MALYQMVCVSNGMKKQSIKWPIIAGILLLLFQVSTMPFTLYEKMPWLDIPMHFVGGLIVAWFVAEYFRGEREKMSKLASAVLIIGGAAIVGVGWEWFEWILDNFIFTEHQFMGGLDDTLFDLVMDLLGAIAVTLICVTRLPTLRKHESN